MKVFSKTDIGLLRSSNQDTFRQGTVSETCAWSLVCDGMGGVKGGNIASGIAAEAIEAIVSSSLHDTLPEEEVRALCVHAINEANSSVFSRAVDEPELKGMGTTAILAIVKDGKLYLSHVGDSRAYLKNHEGIAQITTDHSYVQDLVNRGEITQEEAKNHPHRNIITRSVGVHSMVEIDFLEMEIASGDVFFSCSDGLSNYVSEEILIEFFEKSGGEELVDALIQYALKSGGTDNITVSAIYM